MKTLDATLQTNVGNKQTHAEQENLDYHRQSVSPDAVAILRI